MSDSVAVIIEAVRARVRCDKTASVALIEAIAQDELRVAAEVGGGAGLHSLADEQRALDAVMSELTGLGALQPLLDDPEIEEIWINSPDRVFVARNGVAELTSLVLTETTVHELVERMLQSSGRRVDLSSPFVDASLPDGSRVHVTIPDITSRHWAVNIRKFSRNIRRLSDLVEGNSLTQLSSEFLRMSVLAGLNILVSGATQAGKTTMLHALLSAARPNERIVTVEETFELSLSSRDVVAMQCRQASLEGTGEVNLRRLIKEALRMRPDRLVVGEVREAESLDLLIALNSGLPGACSIHANSAQDALAKLCTLPLLAGRNIDASFVMPTVASSIDMVVHCELDRHGRRRIREIVMPTGTVLGAHLEAVTIFDIRDGVLTPTGSMPTRLHKFETAGFDPSAVLRAPL
ncbi:ATPase, T2SS/T4P/T4SS family [Alpinimonas psychrophila]|uniref:Pilus assembly protein CpaF n=1 Tax=Alpinimonas psychrophila TaxID=748908 RepID=A0A7W3JTY1_9MICO|nr:ATPase, T2SS/T4P/T4SS family [Alpinimonas psychrophila]MBA8829042.1 pilus assembly protein CpaF [Alpinimonas psychrophila]